MKRFGDSDDDGEFRAIGRVEVEEEVIGMIEIGEVVGPRVVVDAAEAGQKEKGSAVVGGSIVNWFPFFFGIDRHGCEPLRHAFSQIFLKKSLALDSVGITTQDQSPVAQKRQNEVSPPVVIGQKISFHAAR